MVGVGGTSGNGLAFNNYATFDTGTVFYHLQHPDNTPCVKSERAKEVHHCLSTFLPCILIRNGIIVGRQLDGMFL